MSKPIIAGQKHISEKSAPNKVKTSFQRKTLLDIPQWAKDDAASKGQELRWVDANQMSASGNMHVNSWEIYRRDKSTVPGGGDELGLPPDGTVRRGTVILAVRPIEFGDGHRSELRAKAQRMSAAVKNQGAELKQAARAAGARVIDETEIS